MGGGDKGAWGASPSPPGTHVSSDPFTAKRCNDSSSNSAPRVAAAVLSVSRFSHLIVARTSEVGTVSSILPMS